MELDPEVEDEGPEEGDGVDLAFPHDEAGLSRDLANRAGREGTGQALLDHSGFEVVGRRTLPIESQFGLGLRRVIPPTWMTGEESHRFHRKGGYRDRAGIWGAKLEPDGIAPHRRRNLPISR